ncbi:MAG: hypothetical protein JSW61_15215 [Candidatus Thorarchaeota archaeon]|nr:MAG: hypothetical protein JSW61_15215 [Candidatus Thorarchaeota archaeon]
MKVVYRNYEPDQGLDEIQAEIYTSMSGLPARADQIRGRNTSRAPEMTRYAFTEDGKPLAFITARDSTSDTGRTYIGYPWAFPECPEEVREKLFSEHMKFLKEREETKEIGVTVVSTCKIAEQQLTYLQGKGFTEEDRFYYFDKDLDVREVSKWKLSKNAASYESRLANQKDIDTLIELSMSDPYLKNAFPSEEASRIYFEERVLKEGHAMLIFNGDKPVAAGALLRMQPNGLFLRGDEERIVMRFTANNPEYSDAWNRLVYELAKEAKAAGWSEVPLRVSFYFRTRDPNAARMSGLQEEIVEFEKILVYQGQK